ncbi:succinyl-diaminopimelate desuccinylase [Protaetiibacter mangrovi]|uniref:Succinyl-diaminopimelate desuccinylase n=2 Tax=Microbacteriaceae TaxID=85023 RepID=A0ABT1ZE72_9MICO|nr:succinyl-diaminopimelate desuccinylase [Protaetiibacter mangrovi]MCS0499002.1 succinyl-diaminopimelate desuccinylase [Protaetiibacter mangrovi]TPX04427.1 succinyl-diaminopimelate desuccinylase [Schumannella luteola]
MPALDLTASTTELTRQLVDVFSVSGEEAALADAIEAVLRAQPHLEVIRDGDAVVARTRLGRAQRVVIAGHIDTVPVNGNLPARLDDGGATLWGRGTVDMKGGCAVMLALAVELAAPAVDVTWVWYDNEEVDSARNGLGRIARERPELLEADFAILGEPSNGEIEGGCNGTIRVDVTTRGRRAHSARAWMGENAIHAAAPVLERLAAYEAQEVEVDGLVYRESLSAVRISGGVAGNVIPDECTVHVNYRFAPSRSGAEALAHLEQLFAGLPVEIVVADLAEGARPGLDAPLAQQFVAAVGGEARPKYGWTDVARFSALGIPAVNYGPGDPSLAHADDERVPVAQIERVEAGLRRWLTAG